ncbi:MAG: hypothetical protein Q9190_003870 [Brigantiaea leucoxantha]
MSDFPYCRDRKQSRTLAPLPQRKTPKISTQASELKDTGVAAPIQSTISGSNTCNGRSHSGVDSEAPIDISSNFHMEPESKDPKSFSQYLFASSAVKVFQEAGVAERLPQWAPWRDQKFERVADKKGNGHLDRKDRIFDTHIKDRLGAGENLGKATPPTLKSKSKDQPLHGSQRLSQSRITDQASEEALRTISTDRWMEVTDQEELPAYDLLASVFRFDAPKDLRTWAQLKDWIRRNLEKVPQGSLQDVEGLQSCLSIDPLLSSVGPKSNFLEGRATIQIQQNDSPQTSKSLLSLSDPAISKSSVIQSDLPLQGSKSETNHFVSSSDPACSPDAQDDLADRECGLSNLAKPSRTKMQVPETLSHFTIANVTDLASVVHYGTGHYMDAEMYRQFGRTGSSICLSRPSIGDSYSETTFAFAIQSIIYILRSPRSLLRSFRLAVSGKPSPAIYSLPFNQITGAMRTLLRFDIDTPNVLSCLWQTAGNLYASPPSSYDTNSVYRSFEKMSLHSFDKTRTSDSTDADCELFQFRNEIEIAHIFKIIMAALTASVPACRLKDWAYLHKCHKLGLVMSKSSMIGQIPNSRILQSLIDTFEDEMALSLVARAVNAIASRLRVVPENQRSVLDMIYESIKDLEQPLVSLVPDTLDVLEFEYVYSVDHDFDPGAIGPSYVAMIVEWLRCLLLKEWDGKAEVSRSSTVSSVLLVMSHFYSKYNEVCDPGDLFELRYISDRLDLIEMPAQWLESDTKANTIHLLQYPFLFSPSVLVSYFKSINYTAMLERYEETMRSSRVLSQMSFPDSVSGRREMRLEDRFKHLLKGYFVLEIRRDSILEDAFNQLWKRDVKELLKPLKIRMGADEGEEGVDHGGVQQEFFRVAISQFVNPDYGLFTMDEQSHMSWFHPCPLEPLWKMELIGLLFSLAIYNGLTLPVSFPRVFYYHLLGVRDIGLSDIRDGWPVLAKGLGDLLLWTDGDVEDVFARTYEFSAGIERTFSVNMKRVKRNDEWQFTQNDLHHKRASATNETLATSEPEMVTNANRGAYVCDYIFWLTDKSIRPQLNAFLRGFYTCLSPKAIRIFNPRALQRLIEGIRKIDSHDLELITQLEGGFEKTDRVVQDFWAVVHEFDQEKLKALLEFVTASDRLPAVGLEGFVFSLQRNGEGDERLPTSLTCFGRLLLPAYSSKEKLRERLCLAIENCKGFGVP